MICHGHACDNEADAIRPQLTSLIDVMTILLVFLLKNFTVEGNLITQPKDVDLPLSTIKEQALPEFSIQLTDDSLQIEGKTLLSIASFENSDSMMIVPLYEAIKDTAVILKEMTKKTEISIQADEDTPFNVVKRVMFTCNQAGFEDFSILVQREGS